jgi:outer membrane murein-binding lipoprotein Lpp
MAARLIVVLACASLFSGCDTSSATQLEAASTKVSELGTQVEALRKRIDTLEKDQELTEWLRDGEAIAYLTPADSGYSVIRTNLGYLTVQIQDVQPYANGSRVILQFGNLSSARINRAKAKLEWGVMDANGSPRNDAARSRDIELTDVLRSGAWTNVPVVLDGVPPASLGFVRVRNFEGNQISLFR